MKRCWFCILFVTISLFTYSKGDKVIDKSAKQIPSWVFGMEKGYIITSAEETTMDMARSLCMQQVKERILSSVAEHVESKTSMSSSEIVTESDIQSLSTFAKQIKTQSADIPFLNNISESHVEDYYWEKIQKQNGEIVYVYNIKYPFSELQIRLIIKEWKDAQEQARLHDAELDEKIVSFRDVDFSTMATIEAMLASVNEVVYFQKSLPQEDYKHKSACNNVLEEYNRQLGNLQIRAISITREALDFELYFGSNLVSYQKKPKITSNCLTEIQFTPTEQGGHITYNFLSGCYEDDVNSIEISYFIYQRKIKNQFYIK